MLIFKLILIVFAGAILAIILTFIIQFVVSRTRKFVFQPLSPAIMSENAGPLSKDLSQFEFRYLNLKQAGILRAKILSFSKKAGSVFGFSIAPVFFLSNFHSKDTNLLEKRINKLRSLKAGNE